VRSPATGEEKKENLAQSISGASSGLKGWRRENEKSTVVLVVIIHDVTTRTSSEIVACLRSVRPTGGSDGEVRGGSGDAARPPLKALDTIVLAFCSNRGQKREKEGRGAASGRARRSYVRRRLLRSITHAVLARNQKGRRGGRRKRRIAEIHT